MILGYVVIIGMEIVCYFIKLCIFNLIFLSFFFNCVGILFMIKIYDLGYLLMYELIEKLE